eukprot:Nitzschia sp. Nitz4//scaffold41_size133979//42374//46364//NITZ4_003339-RA/size133979-snap-gene-0.118-mRNA-1//-1//CDS//3329551446//8602//frame0
MDPSIDKLETLSESSFKLQDDFNVEEAFNSDSNLLSDHNSDVESLSPPIQAREEQPRLHTDAPSNLKSPPQPQMTTSSSSNSNGGTHHRLDVAFAATNDPIRDHPPSVKSEPLITKQNSASMLKSALRTGPNNVIELSDDDDDDYNEMLSRISKRQRLEKTQERKPKSTGTRKSPPPPTTSSSHIAPRPTTTTTSSNGTSRTPVPKWMNEVHQQARPVHNPTPSTTTSSYGSTYINRQSTQQVIQGDPVFVDMPPGFVPTWENPMPRQAIQRPARPKRFELSLVNVKEFTITGLPVDWESEPSSLDGLRKVIKDLSRGHGNATFERDKAGGQGRWHIPLGAYRSFFNYLISQPLVTVTGIPENQLKIASLGKAHLDKGYPTVSKIVSLGVPKGLAMALAPFQRGGVDFVVEKEGRALIADEMGLGKTVQGIASMAVYHQEWPVLVLTPSSARYHWEHEFQHWLGKSSPINTMKPKKVSVGDDEPTEDENDVVMDESKCMPLLEDSQIHVLTSGKDTLIPNSKTKVVICSYGLAPSLAMSGKLMPGLFRVAIVDESHMLKNINAKRTQSLVPVLHATTRCVLLSGTPALAKPSELWPQLKILSTEKTGWWENEEDFIRTYVKNSSPRRRAELHAMLTGTVMIRRLKTVILKSLPRKLRSKAVIDVNTPKMRSDFHSCMILLRTQKGQVGKLARQHTALKLDEEDFDSLVKNHDIPEELTKSLKQESDRRFIQGLQSIEYALYTTQTSLNDVEKERFRRTSIENLQRELQVWYFERIHEHRGAQTMSGQEITQKSVLMKMYSLSGRAKVPLVSRLIRKWIADPSKGKLCVFAHHIFVLDELVAGAGLSNSRDSTSKYIRIDGSTSPKDRQAQIKTFQEDPTVRIAILGITAAGVAVTLTAASTVWFAELFWTPALMIQAEDRCHRIGQNARVNCLYFVATGTLDELLWKLLEKKFRDLGEFVEGQEKQKIVLHTTYHGTKKLYSMFRGTIDDDEDGAEGTGDDENETEEGTELLKLEKDLQGNIAMLEREELAMMKTEGDDDENSDEAKNPESTANSADTVLGSTEDEAILLSDDEEEDRKPKPESSESTAEIQPNGSTTHSSSANGANNQQLDKSFSTEGPLNGCCGYTIAFSGTSFGVQMFMYHGRPVVGRRLDSRYDRPGAGDVVVAVNGNKLPLINDINQIVQYLKLCLSQGSCSISFIEVPALKEMVTRKWEAEQAEQSQQPQQEYLQAVARGLSRAKSENEPVIDLLDD